MKKMSIVKLSLLLMILLGWAAQARADVFSLKALPPEGKSLSDFIPKGWTVEDQVSGDLNGDGISDIAAILVQAKPDGPEDELQRALIVLLGGSDKDKFVPDGANNQFLQCKGCGGIKEMEGIGIKKGVLVVDQWMGSREFAIETWRLRYDPRTKRLLLIGKDRETGDGMEGKGTIESFNYLTGQKITETYHYDESGERKITISSKKEKSPRETPFLEDIKPEW